MTGRERILTVLDGKEPDQIPTMEWVINQDVISQIAGYTSDVRFVSEYDIDGIAVSLVYRNEKIDDTKFRDEWGVVRVSNDEYPTPVGFPIEEPEDFAKFILPDPDDDLRYSKILEVQKEIGKEKAVVPRVKDVISIPRDLMGFENFLISFYTEPKMVDEMMAMCVENSTRVARNLKSLGLEVIVIGDDIATNSGLLISPDMWRSQVYPHFKKLVGNFKDIGLKVIKHSDGDLSSILDELVDSGIDCLDPIDPLGNMDMGEMKKRFGHRIALKGNVDCVHTLVNKPLEDVERDVKECIRKGAAGGGMIISSSNTIHKGINPNNYKYFLECVKRYGKYPLNVR